MVGGDNIKPVTSQKTTAMTTITTTGYVTATTKNGITTIEISETRKLPELVKDLGLSKGTVKKLNWCMQITTTEQLLSISKSDLENAHHIGKVTINNIINGLKKYGRTLKK